MTQSRGWCGGATFRAPPGVHMVSPTCDIDAHNLLLSWASFEGVLLKAGNASNAYFQGEPARRLPLLKPPHGGLPDDDTTSEAMLVARVPIYDTKGAARGFWKKFRGGSRHGPQI